MAEQQATSSTELSFTEGELEALRGMVADWISERLAEPPYPADFDSAIAKLGIAA